MIKRDEFIPMMESGVIPRTFLKQKVRPCIPRTLYGFLFLMCCSGSVLFSTSFHKVPLGSINIISGTASYDSKYYFELPWDYTERVNVPIRGNNLLFPTLTARRGESGVFIYKNCELQYDISNLDKFAEAINGHPHTFTISLVETVADFVEKKISNMTSPKLTLSLGDVDPLSGFDYLSSQSFNCSRHDTPTPVAQNLNTTNSFG